MPKRGRNTAIHTLTTSRNTLVRFGSSYRYLVAHMGIQKMSMVIRKMMAPQIMNTAPKNDLII
jgi:hypothetical protein